MASFAAAAILLCASCETAPPPQPAGGQATVLESSSPADGATLSRSPADLVLRFTTPLRLQELSLTGANGQSMPMMVTAAGEARIYSIPLPDLDAGAYAANWRASADAGASYSGTVRFTIR